MQELSCADRIREHYLSRIEDIRTLWQAHLAGEDEIEDLGSIYDYGLSFDYVAPGTFNDQSEGYWRWQLSWGGPSDEFRFYASSADDPCYKIEYWFLDWYDGAKRYPRGADEELLQEIWTWFSESGSAEHQFKEAREAA